MAHDLAAEIARILVEDETLPPLEGGWAEAEILRRYPMATSSDLRRAALIAVEIELTALPEERPRHADDA